MSAEGNADSVKLLFPSSKSITKLYAMYSSVLVNAVGTADPISTVKYSWDAVKISNINAMHKTCHITYVYNIVCLCV